jgi:purine-binding chemotaxis protein CheW
MSAATTDHQLVVFRLGVEEYAFGIEHVHEIIRHTPPRAVSSPDPWVRGVISLRGRIVPVHDLAARLGLAARAEADAAKIVILDVDGEVAGVVVDDVEEVLTVQPDRLEPVPVAGDGAIQAIVNLGERLVALLDPAALFADRVALEVG